MATRWLLVQLMRVAALPESMAIRMTTRQKLQERCMFSYAANLSGNNRRISKPVTQMYVTFSEAVCH